jgi:hypothetical protein
MTRMKCWGKRVTALTVATVVVAFSDVALAATGWMRDVEVTQLGAYQHGYAHHVWFSVQPPDCPYPLSFSHSAPGGNAMVSNADDGANQ